MQVNGYKNGELLALEVWPLGSGQYLRFDAAAYFCAMREAAREDKLELVVNSSFRPAAKQRELYEQYQRDLQAFIQRKAPKKPAPVARPGYSNHQGGVAVDINRAPGDNPATAAPDSPVDLWLVSNAARFGFKRTVAVEPWHFEYFPELVNAVS